ncbi:MAG: carboxypeptidase regulatory-like domain-containing protein [Pirellulaceae bacterium]
MSTMRIESANYYLLAVLTGFFLFGCNRQDQPASTEKYPVEGKVTFEDGQPVAGVLVSFSSLDERANASALTDDEGHYRVNDDDGEGLPAGEYRVVVGPPVTEQGTAPPIAVDPKYANKKTSGLTTTIKPLPNYYDIECEREPVRRESVEGVSEVLDEVVEIVEDTTDLTPDVEPISRGSLWLKRELASSDAHLICEIIDVTVDFRHGRVAFIAVDPFFNDEEKGAKKGAVLLLPEMLWAVGGHRFGVDLTKEKFDDLPRIEMNPTDRELQWDRVAAYFEGHWSTFEEFCEVPYWTDKSKPPLLRQLSTVLKTPVASAQQKELGQIVDVAITRPRGRVAYVALRHAGGSGKKGVLYPVPLPAFVLDPKSDTWVLEVPADVLEDTPTFPADAWAKELDRGWIEYVHVRYGNAAFGGVQLKSHD